MNLFGTIRQLFIEQGRVRKYLLYALGEIILVMIGILLALKVNNWNSDRLNRAKEQEYIHRMRYEILADINYYTGIKERFQNKEKSLYRIIKVWQMPQPHIADSLEYIHDFVVAGNVSSWYNEPVTWDQLIQTGDLNLIRDNHLIEALYNYHNLVKRISDNYSVYPTQMANQARVSWSIPFRQEALESFMVPRNELRIPAKAVYENIWSERIHYLDLYISLAYITTAQVQNMEEIIQTGNELLQLLQEKAGIKNELVN